MASLQAPAAPAVGASSEAGAAGWSAKRTEEGGRLAFTPSAKQSKRPVQAAADSPSDTDADRADPKGTVTGALRKIERLCAVREQSSQLLSKRLVREGFDAACVEEAVERALSCGLLNDARYAECLVRSRLAAGRGVPGIERELSQCGLSLSDVDGWPERFDYREEDETQRALALLRRNPPRSKNRREGAFRKLSSKGFSAAVAASAARQWSESLDAG